MNTSKRHLISLLLALTYGLFILPITEHIAFTLPTDRHTLILSYELKLLFAVFFYISIYALLGYITKLRAKDPLALAWLKYSAIYFVIMLVVFLLIYPGHWVGDEFNILPVAKVYGSYAWQNYFTNIYYTFCLYLIPTGVGIIFIQFTLASMVVGYIIANVGQLLKHKYLARYLFIPFLLFPIVLNNFYPLRAALYSYAELLVIATLIFRHYGLRKNKSIYLEILWMSFIIMLVSFWRTEGIYYLVLFPVLLLSYGVFSRKNRKSPLAYVTVVLSLSIIGLGYGITRATSNPMYALTAEINPLSTMLQKPLHGDHIQQRLNEINQVISIKDLKEHPSYTEIPAFWNGGIREKTYRSHIQDYKKQYFYLVIHNPGSFMDNRVKVFLSSNTFYSLAPATLGPLDDPNYMQNATAAKFVATNHFARPLAPKVKEDVSALLLGQNSKGKINILGHVFWDAIPPIFLLLIIMCGAFVKKNFFWAAIAALVLIRVPLLFFTAPANYFFYYQSIYLIGYFVAIFLAVIYMDTHKVSRGKN